MLGNEQLDVCLRRDELTLFLQRSCLSLDLTTESRHMPHELFQVILYEIDPCFLDVLDLLELGSVITWHLPDY